MIRKIEVKDKELFFELSREFYSSPAVLCNIPEAYHASTFDELMRSEEYLMGYIFELDGAPVGYGLLNVTYGHEAGGRVVWIEEIYVREGYRSRGIGREFFEYVFKNVPAARYRLEVEPENERAVKLYEGLGFEVLGYGQMVRDERGKR